MPSRRDLLAALGTSAMLGLAGCSFGLCTAAEPQYIPWCQPGGNARNTAADTDHSAPAGVAERWRIDSGVVVAPLGNGVLTREAGELVAYTACEN